MITAALGLDISDFQSKLSKAGAEVSKIGKGGAMGALSAGFGAAAAAIAAAAAAVGTAAVGMYKAMEAGGELIDLQEQTGIAVDKLMLLQVGFEQAGLAASDVQPVINKMQKALAEAASGNAQAAASFQSLGLSINTLAAMSPEEQLAAVGDAIAKIENPTRKAQAAMEIFGKSGGKMLALFAAGGLDTATRALGNQAQLMAQNAGLFDKITDTLGTAAVKVQGFFVGMASAIAPQLMAAVDAFEGIDLSGIGQQIGAYVAVFLEAFRQGTLGTLMTDSMVAAGEVFVNGLYAGISAVFTALGRILVEVVAGVFSGYFLDMLLRIMLSAGQTLVAAVLDGLGASKMASVFRKRAEENVELAGESAAKVQEAQAAATEGMGSISDALKAGFQSAMEARGPSVAAQEVSNQIAGLLEKAKATGEAARAETPTPTPSTGGLTVARQVSTAGFETLNSLAKIGGAMGGGFVIDSNPVLDENRKQTSVLEQIAMNTSRMLENRQQPTGGLVLA